MDIKKIVETLKENNICNFTVSISDGEMKLTLLKKIANGEVKLKSKKIISCFQLLHTNTGIDCFEKEFNEMINNINNFDNGN